MNRRNAVSSTKYFRRKRGVDCVHGVASSDKLLQYDVVSKTFSAHYKTVRTYSKKLYIVVRKLDAANHPSNDPDLTYGAQ